MVYYSWDCRTTTGARQGNTITSPISRAPNTRQATTAPAKIPCPHDYVTHNYLNLHLVEALQYLYDKLEKKDLTHGDPKPENLVAAVMHQGVLKIAAVDLESAVAVVDQVGKMCVRTPILTELYDIVVPGEW